VFVTNLATQRHLFRAEAEQIAKGTGSGFVWDHQGHIVTNFHVVQGATDVKITLADGAEADAVVVGVDAARDIAVLQIEVPEGSVAKPIPKGRSKGLLVGQRAYAIGNPFGLDHTLTTGVISGLGREITGRAGRPISGIIQTDAAINPGSSGGPLINSRGELIGINTMIASPSGANAGVGFAIPVDLVKGSVSQIIRHGRVTRPSLGIQVGPDHIARRFGIGGVLVLGLQPRGAAAAAGVLATLQDRHGRVRLGEVVVGLNGKEIEDTSDLYRALEDCQVEEKVKLRLAKLGKGRVEGYREVEVALQEAPGGGGGRGGAGAGAGRQYAGAQ
jgi:S1-C subfamily serine protease